MREAIKFIQREYCAMKNDSVWMFYVDAERTLRFVAVPVLAAVMMLVHCSQFRSRMNDLLHTFIFDGNGVD